jgi:hypothetical protein
MPSYALSAYELISREVECIYLKLPKEIDVRVIMQPIDDTNDDKRKWIKQHIYVLMTRATIRLVVNVENSELYRFFEERLDNVKPVKRTLQ